MKPKSFGVAKWSTPRSGWNVAFGRVGRPREVPVAEHDEDRAGHLGQHAGVEAGAPAADEGRERRPVDPGLGGQAGEVLDDRRLGRAAALDRGGDQLRGVLLAEEVGTDPGDDDPGEAAGILGGQREDHPGAHREPDGVDRPVGQQGGDLGLEPVVGRGVVGLGGLAVAEQVGGDDLAPGVPQQVDPAVVPPRPGRRGGEAVQQQDRFVAHGRFLVGAPGHGRAAAGVRPAHVER